MQLTLVLTHACNLACRYCYAGPKSPRRMSRETGRYALEQSFSRLEPGAKIQVGYFGGEPLLAWELLQELHLYARELAERKAVTLTGTVTTNATLLDEAKMEWLASHGVVVGVSIDGVQAAHEAARPAAGGGSSFEAVRRGLHTALSRAPLTETISVVDPSTVRHMHASARFLLEEGVRVLSFSLNHSAEWDEPALAVYERECERIGDEFIARYRSNCDVYIAALDAKIIGHLKRGLKECDRCSFGAEELAVAPSGNLYPCERLVGGDTDPRWQIGTIQNGLDQAKLAEISRCRMRADPACQACALRNRCMNFCGCSNIFSSGDAAIPGAVICRTEQIHARVADRVGKTLFWDGNPIFLRKYYFETQLVDPRTVNAAAGFVPPPDSKSAPFGASRARW